MKQVQEYRSHAGECRTMAAKMKRDDLRAQLLDMAGKWEALATEREKILRTREMLNSDDFTGALHEEPARLRDDRPNYER